MNPMQDCVAIIPCFNEAGTVGNLVRAVREFIPTVIVVDDGSTDATAENAAAAGAEVLRQPRNQGKGDALQAGFHHARARSFNWAITLDGDGQHHPGDIPALIARSEETGAALVVGNRLMNAGPMPWLRRNVNRWMSQRLSHLAGVSLADSQCGMRLVKLDAWSELNLNTEHFEFESEMLIEFAKAGHNIEFVPVQVIYNSRPSRIRPLIDSWRWFRWWYTQLRPNTIRRSLLPALFLRRFSGLQHNPRSVGHLHFHSNKSGLQGETAQFRPPKPALD